LLGGPLPAPLVRLAVTQYDRTPLAGRLDQRRVAAVGVVELRADGLGVLHHDRRGAELAALLGHVPLAVLPDQPASLPLRPAEGERRRGVAHGEGAPLDAALGGLAEGEPDVLGLGHAVRLR